MYNMDQIMNDDELLDELDSWKATWANPDATIETEVKAEQRIEEIAAELKSRGIEVEY